MGKPGSAGALKKAGGVACGAKRRRGGRCVQPAGFGTDHPGIGCCRFHGGNTPNHVKAAATEEYRVLLGNPIEINPLQALLRCIHIRYGEVEWLTMRIADLDQKDWIHDTIMGKQLHMWVRERHAAMADLARYSQMAISLGIAERAVKLAETYGEMLAKLIQGILGDLELDDEQRARVPQVVRKHLILMDGGIPDEPQPQIEAA